ncbi:MAG TPA: ATP-binding protein [Chryseosolibacter sp.]|nr:ATP-binding protein [Chryseosolibacter sp.]
MNPAPRVNSNSSWALWLVVIFLLFISAFLFYQIKRRQLATEQLNALHGQLTNLFENAPCGYHVLGEDGYFVNINTTLRRWLGYEKEEMIGKLRFTDIVDDSDLGIIDTKSGAIKTDVNIRLKKKTGGTLPVILGIVKGDATKHDRILYSTIDNSQCAQALERIKTLDQELEAFSYSISHDLRAPLRSIDGYSKILQEDYAGKLDGEGARVLNIIMNNARRMGKLIDDLLDFGRLGRKNIQRSQINMTGMINNVIHDLLQQKDGRVEIKVDSLLPAFADADMIRQVWFNLLDNAVKFSGKKERAVIEVRSYTTGEGEVCYEVKDNGDGFDMKYAPKLFGIFQRLHKMQDFAGTGVGLAIVKRIISRHGGRVWAEGTLHQGAVFYFTIPRGNDNE